MELKYIMLINSIVNVGGGQKYCSNKVTEIKKRRYRVVVISTFEGEVLLEPLKEFEKNIMIELRYPPRYFSKEKKRKIIQKIERITGKIDKETIIDCSMTSLAEWGELLAQRHKCKNVCFFIDEKSNLTRETAKFFEFKLNRSELFGSSAQIIPQMFNHYKKIEAREEYAFMPYCINVVEDVNCELAKKIATEASLNIAFFGRLDKPYMLKAMKQLCPFLTRYSDMTFNVVLIGGAESDYKEKQLMNLYNDFNNVELYTTGFLNPVPRDLLKSLDVCIAAAGCAMVADDEDVPTICVDVLTGKPIGIVSYTVNRYAGDLRYGNNKNVTLVSLLEDILFYNYCKRNSPKYKLENNNFEKVMQKEIDSEFEKINRVRSREYYDINSIQLGSGKERISKLILTIAGPRVLNRVIYEFWQKIKEEKWYEKIYNWIN